jgi:hypothetical protein
MPVSSLWIFAECLFIRFSPGPREYQAMVAPLGPPGQSQSLTARKAIGKQSIGRVEALEPGRLPDIPRIPDGWDQGRSFRCLRQRYIARSVRSWQSKQPTGRAEERKPADLPSSGRTSSIVCPSLSAFRTFTLARPRRIGTGERAAGVRFRS